MALEDYRPDCNRRNRFFGRAGRLATSYERLRSEEFKPQMLSHAVSARRKNRVLFQIFLERPSITNRDLPFSSHRERSALRQEFGHDFAIVTPGARPAGCGADDQARVVTPAEAIAAGATHIVTGRPITEREGPAAEARAILGQLVA
jgi:orotidine-5'-phosphate decarboxylase